MTSDKSRDMTGDDFITGLIAGIVLQGIRIIEFPPIVIEEAVVAAFQKVEAVAEEQGVELRFWLSPHPQHLGSPEVHTYLIRACYDRGLFTTDMPGYTIRIEMDEEWALGSIERLALGVDEFKQAARAFLDELAPAKARYGRDYYGLLSR